jgi:glycosyltransferase involved in cell wall biosynthesis
MTRLNGFMRPILFLIPDLHYHGRSRQASLLAPALPRNRFVVGTFSLRGPGPFAEPLRDANLDVLGKASRSRLDLEGLFSLRRLLLASPPSLIHVWGVAGLRGLGWAVLPRRKALPPIVVSLSAVDLRRERWTWWNRVLCHLVKWFVVANAAERELAIAAGLPSERIRAIRPGVAPPTAKAVAASADFRTAHGIAPGETLFMGVGHFNRPDRFLRALLTFEILHGIEPTMKLMLIGDGPFRKQTAKRFYFSAMGAPGVQFLGARPDAAALLTHADVVFAGHQGAGGMYGVLEAMAAGRPALVSKRPNLAGFIRDGETGFLVESSIPTTYTRLALQLFREESLRREVGAAARAEAAANYRVDTMAAVFAELYDEALA